MELTNETTGGGPEGQGGYYSSETLTICEMGWGVLMIQIRDGDCSMPKKIPCDMCPFFSVRIATVGPQHVACCR